MFTHTRSQFTRFHFLSCFICDIFVFLPTSPMPLSKCLNTNGQRTSLTPLLLFFLLHFFCISRLKVYSFYAVLFYTCTMSMNIDNIHCSLTTLPYFNIFFFSRLYLNNMGCRSPPCSTLITRSFGITLNRVLLNGILLHI